MTAKPKTDRAGMAKLSIALLGAPQIEQNGAGVEVDTRKAIAALTYIAVEKGGHSRDTIATLLWPESDADRARAALRRTLSVMRKAILEEFLNITRDTIELVYAPGLWVDIEEFRRLARAHQDHNPKDGFCANCASDLRQAAALYRDDFLSGFTLRDSAEFDDWQFYQADSLRRELAAVLERLVLVEAAQGEMEAAIQYARRRLAIDPLHEPAHRQLMRLYNWAGRRNAALRQYQECARILREELDVDPLEETQELYTAIRENRETTPLPELRKSEQPAGAQPSPPAAIITPHHYPLAGRDEELARLEAAYTLADDGGRLVTIEGEAGVGKTRLAREFIQRVQRNGCRLVAGRAFQGEENLAYAPLADAIRQALEADPGLVDKIDPAWLSEAARLLPELRERANRPLQVPANDAGAQTRLYEAFFQILLAFSDGPRPGILFFDDLHWADDSTLEFLAYSSRRLPMHPRLLLLARRDEDSAQAALLARLSAEATRSGRGESISLSRLAPGEIEALVAVLPLDTYPVDPELSARLYQETEGLPFFLVEYLDRLATQTLSQAGGSWSLTPGSRDLLHARLSGLSESGMQLLQTAAVIGRQCDFDVLREASGRAEEEAISTLETLIARGILQESEREEGISIDFSHQKLRSLVYEETSPLRRRLLHRRVAQTLVSPGRNRTQVNILYGLAAHHYRLGGQPGEAAYCHVQAGDQAANLLAHGEALSHYQSALALGYSEPAEIAEKIADEQILLGDYPDAKMNYQSAAAHYPEGSASLGRLAHKMGRLFQRMGDWGAAEAQFEYASGALEGGPGDHSRLYADWSLTAYQSGRMQRAAELAECACRLAEESDNRQALAQAHNLLGILARGSGQFEQAVEHLKTSLELARTGEVATACIAALNNLALALADLDEIDEAIGNVCEALELCRKVGDRHRQAALHNNLADLYHARGDRDAAMAELKNAVTIFAEIGGKAEENLPTHSEIWKLSEW